jgi:hypothetical protein
VAQKLNVATILEGSVRKAGSRVRITAQLVQVATDSHLWSETYDRELEDILAVQDDIARSVVKELRAALLGERPGAPAGTHVAAEVQAAVRGRSTNAEAYRLYLQGSFFQNRYNDVDMAKAIDYFRRPIVDPKCACDRASYPRATSTRARTAGPRSPRAERARTRRALALERTRGRPLGARQRPHALRWDWKRPVSATRVAAQMTRCWTCAPRADASLSRNEAAALVTRALALVPKRRRAS